MQYLLTPDEYKDLVQAGHDLVERTKQTVQELCTRVANYEPVRRRWAPKEEPAPWGCILNPTLLMNPGYCDECPVSKLCPHPNKLWSK